jgi:quercetin dioxygenase-like cupin family protein
MDRASRQHWSVSARWDSCARVTQQLCTNQIKAIHFKESPPHASFEWHTAPERQYVITLLGTLEFTT